MSLAESGLGLGGGSGLLLLGDRCTAFGNLGFLTGELSDSNTLLSCSSGSDDLSRLLGGRGGGGF